MDLIARLAPALIVAIGGPLVVLWWVKRNKIGGGRRLRLADRLPLSRGLLVAIVEADERTFLIGAGENGVSLISELETPNEEHEALQTMDATSEAASNEPRTGWLRQLQDMTLRRPPDRELFDASHR